MDIFLSDQDQAKVAAWLRGAENIPGLDNEKLRKLQAGEATAIDIADIGAICDYKWPEALSDVIRGPLIGEVG